MGATSGIGQEVARLLAANGYEVGIAGRREERLVQMAQATPGIVTHRQIDVTKEDAPTELYKLIEELGGMDLYFHSSGIGWENVALDADKELKTVETNGVGFVRMVSAAYNWFAEQRADEAKQRAEGDEQRAGDKERKARIACITSIARTRGLGAAQPTLPRSACKLTTWSVFRSRPACAILTSASPTYAPALLPPTSLRAATSLYSLKPNMWHAPLYAP